MNQRVSDERLNDAIEIATRQNLPDTLELALDLQDARVENSELRKRIEAVNDMKAVYGLDENIPDDKEKAYHLGYGDGLIDTTQVLRGES